MSGIPSLAELQQYNPNRPDAVEALAWSMYDSLTYTAAGQTQLQFFQVPKGQSGKTFADTNMTAAGLLPAPQSFLIQTIELLFFPGEVPGAYGANAAPAFTNDTYKFYTSAAWLELYIGSKAYLDQAPLLSFPPKNGLSGFAAASDSSTAGAGQGWNVNYASGGGQPYELNPPILLVPTQNFNVTLNWPAVIAITANAKVFVKLDGILYRNSQ